MPGKAAKVKVGGRRWEVFQELGRSRKVAKGIVRRALILVPGRRACVPGRVRTTFRFHQEIDERSARADANPAPTI